MHESVHHSHRHLGLRLSFTVALLAMLAPFSIDTYLPSFPDIGREFSVSSVVLQQTLSFYLLAFATMMLVYGPLSDAYGRKTVVLVSTAVYVATSIGCALAQNIHWLLLMRIGQGISASGALVVGRAIIRDAFAGAAAQRVMSQVMLIFALAPAVAPVIGGWLHDAFGWRSVFWFLVLLGLAVWLWSAFFLPETLPPVGRQSGHPRAIASAYGKALGTPRFMILIAVDVFPAHRGLASALQGFGQAGFNAVVAGALAPLLSSRVELMAGGMLMLNLTGLGLWWFWRHREDAAEPVPVLP